MTTSEVFDFKQVEYAIQKHSNNEEDSEYPVGSVVIPDIKYGQ